VVKALELQLEIVAPHERLVHGGLELEDVVADRQVVLEPERRQNDAVSNRERQSQFVVCARKQQILASQKS